MASLDAEPSWRAFLTMDAIRAEHGRLLDLVPDAVAGVADYVRQVRDFVGRLVESGVYFDELGERRAIQGYLDHWMGELSSRATAEQSADLIHLELRAFDVAALRALQDTLVNPFTTVSVDIASLIAMLSDGSRRTAIPILKWLEDRAKAAGLRVQDGLLKEIASQVAVDPEGASLLEFCLWHLFEDPATRIGNKIERPEGELTFVCVGYLAEHAQKLCAAQSKSAQTALIAALGAFEPSPSDSDRAAPASTRTVLRNETVRFALYQRRDLALQDFLLASRLTFLTQGGKLRLVHRSLLNRWNAVAVARATRLERAKGNRQKWRLAGGFLGMLVVGSLAWIAYGEWAKGKAIHYAGKAANDGARAIAVLQGPAYTDESPSNDPREAQKGVMLAKQYYADQLADGLRAVGYANTGDSRKSLRDGISGAIGFLAQVGALGDLPRYAKVESCEQAPPKNVRRDAELCVTDGASKVAIDERAMRVSAPVLNQDGTRLAGVWKRDKGLILRAYAVNFVPAEDRSARSERLSLAPLRDIPLPRACELGNLRFVAGGTGVQFDCLDRGQSVSVYVPLAAENSGVQVVNSPDVGRASSDPQWPCKLQVGTTAIDVQLVPSRSPTIFLSPGEQGALGSFITTGEEGYLRLWPGSARASDAQSRKPCPKAQFFSDFIRMVTGGSASELAFREDSAVNYFVLFYDTPPVIRIYEQRDPLHARQIVEHYPQHGLGNPYAVDFTRNGSCVAVHARRGKPLTKDGDPDYHYVRLTYYLLLDKAGLKDVGEALGKDIADLTMSPSDLQNPVPWRQKLPTYAEAIKKQCGVAVKDEARRPNS